MAHLAFVPSPCINILPSSFRNALRPFAHIHNMRKRRPLKPPSIKKPQLSSSVPTAQLHHYMPRRPATLALALAAATVLIATLTIRYRRGQSDIIGFASKGANPSKQATDRDGIETSTAPVLAARVVAEYAHDPYAFTQGLLWHDGMLYESTGLQGRSTVRRVDLESGEVVQSHRLKRADFGEGLSLFGGDRAELVQMLWKVGKGYIYDRDSLKPLSEFRFKGDAWGITPMPGRTGEFYLSDGSSCICKYRLDGGDFVKIGEFIVRDGEREVGLLNELEMVGDELWANVWMSDFVARIDPATGLVASWVDFRNLLHESDIPPGHQVDVLNGIAWDATQGRIFITGKLWPKLYSIQVRDHKIADNIESVTNAFFLDPSSVRYVHRHVLA